MRKLKSKNKPIGCRSIRKRGFLKLSQALEQKKGKTEGRNYTGGNTKTENTPTRITEWIARESTLKKRAAQEPTAPAHTLPEARKNFFFMQRSEGLVLKKKA